MRSLAFAIFLVCWSASGQTLTKRLEAILKSSPEAQGGFWGIRVVDLKTGASVYRRNETQFFVPASNAKLFSTALALMRLGPDHRFETRVFADAKPDEQGRVSEIRLVGGGDPNLSARVLPYKRRSPPQEFAWWTATSSAMTQLTSGNLSRKAGRRMIRFGSTVRPLAL
jgi:D-alanyl-D-alanine carboxypeptidase